MNVLGTVELMKTKVTYLLLGILLVPPFALRSQVLDAIDVHLTIREKSGEEILPMPNAQLMISDIGKVQTNQEGSYLFTYPVRNTVDPAISISLLSEEHKVLKPLDGSLQLDPTKESMFIELLVVNMTEEDPEFQKRIRELERRISTLQSKNKLTHNQLNALNNVLLDTIMYFEANREMLEQQIADYEQLSEEQQGEISDLKRQISDLENQVNQLTNDLELALEEHYAKQNEYYTDLSSSLLAYLRKAKDVRDHLPNLITYYNAGSFENYDKDIKGYNKVWEDLEDTRLALIEGIDHYWENDEVSHDVEEMLEYLTISIHQNQMYTVIKQINNELSKRKYRKAQKIADLSHEHITVNIRSLEKQINRTLSVLRNNI